VALPLRARGEIIGALDVQSVEPQAFRQEDVSVLQTLADQVAVAISNARLFRLVEESLEAERRAYGEISRQAWQQMVRHRVERGFRCDERGVAPVASGSFVSNLGSEVQRAVKAGQVVVEEDGDRSCVRVPIPVRDQVVGVLNFRKTSADEMWTEDELAVLQTMAEQLGQTLDSARLYQDTQRREVQERIVGEVTARMRETLDMDTVLQTAIREMGTALGIPRIEVRMAPAAGRPGNGGAAVQGEADSPPGPAAERGATSVSQEKHDADLD
jgi:transcriptional regulator with GAF, ATPase, and Fis domain